MRSLIALALFLAPCVPLLASPHKASTYDIPSRPVSTFKPVHVTLVNMSGRPRQLVTRNGLVTLPKGAPVSVDVYEPGLLHVISETDSHVNAYIDIHNADRKKMIAVN